MPAPALTQTPLTELDAVNILLMSIGQAPVNTLSVAGITDVSKARLILHNVSREVQGRGYNFNVDEGVALTRDANNKIAVPSNALYIDAEDTRYNVVSRKDPADSTIRLYDRDNNTFVLTADLICTIKRFLDFEEIPQAARQYITARAGRVFQATAVGSQILYAFTKEMENEAYAELVREEIDSSDNNLFTQNNETAYIAYRELVGDVDPHYRG